MTSLSATNSISHNDSLSTQMDNSATTSAISMEDDNNVPTEDATSSIPVLMDVDHEGIAVIVIPTEDDNDVSTEVATSIHIMDVDEEGIPVIAGVRWEELNIIDDPHAAAVKLFPVNSVWKGYDLLCAVAERYSPLAGFEVKSSSYAIKCNRSGKERVRSKDGKSRNEERPLQVGCGFVIRAKSSVYMQHQDVTFDALCSKFLPGSKDDKDSKVNKKYAELHSKKTTSSTPKKYLFYYDITTADNSPLKHYFRCSITSANLIHSNGCLPSAKQLEFQRCASGKYVSGVSETATRTLCNLLSRKPSTPSSVIKDILLANFPANKTPTRHDVYNTRICCSRLLKSAAYQDNKSDYNSFVAALLTSELANGIDESTITEEESLSVGKEIWRGLLNTNANQSHDDKLVCFGEYLELLKSKTDGFDYELSYDMDGACTGMLWQTATMRENFRRFGSFISLDAMKRGINKLLWPYFAVAMINDVGQICVACEAILCEEREDAYDFIIKSLCQMSDGRGSEEIYAVAGDGFLSQDLLSKWGLKNAKYICDHWHLFNKILPERFSFARGLFEVIQPHLRKMAEAFTEDFFIREHRAVLELVRSMANVDRNVEHEINKFAAAAPTYAVFHLNMIRGSIGRKGSNSSESNHSSVLTFINDGLVGINKYCEYPHMLIKKLFERQGEHINKWNTLLNKQTEQLRIENYRLNAERGDKILIDASQFKLAYMSYEQFKNVVKRSKNYHFRKERDVASGVDVWNIYQYGLETPVQTFKKKEDPCPGCTTCVAHLMMCEYCIALGRNFNLNFFDLRHHYRSKVETCLRQRDTSSHLIGNEMNSEVPGEQFVMNNDGVDDNSVDDHAATDVVNSNYDMALEQYSTIGSEGPRSRTHGGAMLSPKELMTLFGEIVGNKSKCSNEVKIFVDGMAISLHRLVRDGTLTDVNVRMEDIVQRYKSSFSSGLVIGSRTRTDSEKQLVVNKPRTEMTMHASKLRLKPAHENIQSKRIKTTPTVGRAIQIRPVDLATSKTKKQRKARKCSYCGHSDEPRHRIESCPARAKHVSECNNHVTHTELECDKFITRMREEMPICDPITGIKVVTNAIVKNGNQNTSNARHIKVLGCYAKHLSANGYGILEPRQMIFNISVIGATGLVIANDAGIFVEGKELYSFVTNLHITRSSKTDSLRSARYIYDHTYNNTDGSCKSRIKE